jgi:hypothetical protein
LVVFRSGTSEINVYRSEYAGTNKATAVTWTVDNVKEEVADLKSKGVIFEHDDMPDMTCDGDVYVSGDMKVAWFKDPDGNILNVAVDESCLPRRRKPNGCGWEPRVNPFAPSSSADHAQISPCR